MLKNYKKHQLHPNIQTKNNFAPSKRLVQSLNNKVFLVFLNKFSASKVIKKKL